MSQLPADCLNEIFEYLADDKFTLHSCILVNRLWCEISVRILWRNIQNYRESTFSTLIACLPRESKEILQKNGIISTTIFKFPTFNYASFCKALSIREVHYKLELLLKNKLLKNQQFIYSQSLNNSINIIAQEIFKLFVTQITSLKQLEISTFWQFFSWQFPTTNFISLLEAKNCLKNLSELYCSSDISSEFFCQLSQISNNISLLDITFQHYISNGLADLISSQKNLKYFSMTIYYALKDNNQILSLMTKLPNTLIKLNLFGRDNDISLSFINNFADLQELQLTFDLNENFKNFEKLQYINFSQLQILKLKYALPKCEMLINFLENNGKNLKEIYFCDYSMGYSDNSLNLAIAKFCPIIRKLSTGIKNNESETLKIIFDSCKYLESIKIWCGGSYLNEKQALEAVVKYSKNIHEIILDYYQDNVKVGILPEELESLFVNWTDRIPQRSFSLVVVNDGYIVKSLDKNEENIKIIEKYRKLGIIKKFKVTSYDDEEYI
jgi:hypothetical protein